MRSDSSIEVPGTAAMWRMKCPSFSSGRKSPPKNGSAAQPAIVNAAAAAIGVRGHPQAVRNRRS